MDYKSHHLTSSILSCGRYENGPANVATSVLKHAHTYSIRTHMFIHLEMTPAHTINLHIHSYCSVYIIIINLGSQDIFVFDV